MDVGVRIKDGEMLQNMKAYNTCIYKLWNNLEGDNDLFHRYIKSTKDEPSICNKEYQNLE